MADDLKRAFSEDNLARAWLLTKTNSDLLFKNNFRHIYQAYAMSSDERLEDLRNRLNDNIFQTSPPVKVYLPKKSGALRPYTLLSIEDQIVYQALVNVIANKHRRRIKSRYYKTIFGHIYAGNRSKYFYEPWQAGYHAFGDELRQYYQNGFGYIASFDLAAFYDSIDHAVLKQFLKRYGLDLEFCDKLLEFLRKWSVSEFAADRPIYKEHGIPQGPQPSGLLSECVLSHFDSYMEGKRKVKYLRYVDDIRLLSKSKHELEKSLIKLDRLSNEIGLFPHGGKIDIHRITSIESEIKSVSNPPEIFDLQPDPDQKGIQKRLRQLSPRYKVKDVTRFKYVLARMTPQDEMSLRLLRIVTDQPFLCIPIFNHLSKTPQMSERVSGAFLDVLKKQNLYSPFTAAALRAVHDRIDPGFEARLVKFCKSHMKESPPDVTAAIGAILADASEITWQELRDLMDNRDWWVQSSLLRQVNKDNFGKKGRHHVLNKYLANRVADVAIVAAKALVDQNLALQVRADKIHVMAQYPLKSSGLIGRISQSRCPIEQIMTEVLGDKLRGIPWKKILKHNGHYKNILKKITLWRSHSETNATEWVMLTDTFDDLILDCLYNHDKHLGTYTLGKIGGVLTPAPGNRLLQNYPDLFKVVFKIHTVRKKCDLAHAVGDTGKKPTKHVKYREMQPLKRLLAKGYLELSRKW